MTPPLLMELAGAVNYWLKRSGEAVRVFDHCDGAAEILGVTLSAADRWTQCGELYTQLFNRGFVRVAVMHANHELLVDYHGRSISRAQWDWIEDQAVTHRLRVVDDQGHELADWTRAAYEAADDADADAVKDWLMSQEPPLYVEPDKTDPYGRLSHTIGTGDDFVAIDYHVFPDLSVQLHAVLNSETGGFVQNFREPVRVPQSDALEAAQQLTDEALEWMAETGRGPEAAPEDWAESQKEAHRLIQAIGRELYPDYDERVQRDAQDMVERLIG